MNSEDKLILQQVRLIDPGANFDQISDVVIANGHVESIQPWQANDTQESVKANAQELIVAPGLVDLYSRSGEPGYEERETFSSLAAAAAAGGFTRVNVLPNTEPPIDNAAILTALRSKERQVKSISSTQISFWGALTTGIQGQNMSEILDLVPAVVGFADGYSIENLGLLRRLFEYLQPFGKPIALKATNSQLKGNGVMRQGAKSLQYGLPGDPAVSEAAAIAALLELVAFTQTPVHLMKISTSRGVELVADAKARGLPITASTTWMHLLLDTEAVENYDPNLRLDPPLGNPADREALTQGVQQGIIDAVAVDHTPYTYEEKMLSFAEAPTGAIGLELVLSLLWQRFVATNEWSALQLWKALSNGPLHCLGLEPIGCKIGQKAELVLFDPQKTWTVNRENLKSRCFNTPWLGKELTGRIIKVWNL